MPTPHKYAGAIKAWADGKTVQYRSSGDDWLDYTLGMTPAFSGGYQWRVKPETIKYRLALVRWAPETKPVVMALMDDDDSRNFESENSAFVRWLGDWQEVEA